MRSDRDRELVEKSLKGNEKAFRKLIEEHTAVVYSAVRSIIGNSDDADDIVQDIFIRIFRGLSGFRSGSKLSTWIYSIARNESLNAKARTRHEPVPIEKIQEIGTDDNRPDRIFHRRQENLRVRDYISKLEDRYREIIELRYLAEKSYIEVAEIMEIPIGTVKTCIHRAKAELKKMMSGPDSNNGRG